MFFDLRDVFFSSHTPLDEIDLVFGLHGLFISFWKLVIMSSGSRGSIRLLLSLLLGRGGFYFLYHFTCSNIGLLVLILDLYCRLYLSYFSSGSSISFYDHCFSLGDLLI